MKNLITLIAILFISSTYAQTAMTRTIDVKDGQMAKFIEMAGKKTKKYDGPEAATQFYTWNILSGPNAGKIWRVQVGENLASFDEDAMNTPGGKYWQKNVAPTIADNNFTRLAVWQRANNASWSPDQPTGDLMRRAIFYNYKDSGEQDFWTYRQRIVEARKQHNDQSRPATSVWWCRSRCYPKNLIKFFSHASYEDQLNDQEGNLALWEKYDEIYGEGSHEQDVNKMVESLMPNGNRTRHLMLIPEASSDN